MNVAAPGGRMLEIEEAGDPDGFPVVVHHGTPATGLYERWADDARARGIRLVDLTRAGYGGSARAPGRTIADVAADTAAAADALRLERFATWGISGGGPHALACAALLPGRVAAAACLAGPAPFDADGLDWFAGQGESNVVEHETAARGEEALRPLLEEEAEGLRATTPEQLHGALASLVSPPDAAVLTGALAAYLQRSIAAALAAGVDGWLDDDLAFVGRWGFDPGEIRVPVLVRHGEQDRFAPVAHGRWLAARIPGAAVDIGPGDGHLTLMEAIGPVHAWLLEHA